MASGNEITFETEKIEILDNGNRVKSYQGIANSADHGLTIEADNFDYNKVNSILERDDIKQSVKTGEQYGDQLDKVMTQIKTAYIQSIQEIKSNCKDQNEFLEKVQELDNRIENVLLTDEEKEMIQKVREEINTMFGGEEATAMIKYLPF